jgi:hypothetical protein
MDQEMPKSVRLKPEQIVAKLREIEVKLSQGKRSERINLKEGPRSG